MLQLLPYMKLLTSLRASLARNVDKKRQLGWGWGWGWGETERGREREVES